VGKHTDVLVKNAFGDYVGEFEASESWKKQNNEKSRQFSFMSNFDRVPPVQSGRLISMSAKERN
jgi:hypothetical protein